MGALGIFAVCMFNAFRMEKIGFGFKDMLLCLAMCIGLMLVVSRLVYTITSIPEDGISLDAIMDNLLHGGIVFYGGMMGVLLGSALFACIRHYPVLKVVDYMTPSIPLFHIFGRIGCALSGCCYGIESSWGIHNSKFPGVTLFPVQIIESFCNLLIFVMLMVIQKIRKNDKHTTEIYLISYGICRFVLEFFRGDEARGIWPDGLSSSQHIALVMIIAATTVLLVSVKKAGQPA